MARYANPFSSPYPTNPAIAAMGTNLATALFGDPDLRAQAQLRRAQQQEAVAAAGAHAAKEALDRQTFGGRERAGTLAGTVFDFTRPQAGFTPPAPVGAPIMTAPQPDTLASIVGGLQLEDGSANPYEGVPAQVGNPHLGQVASVDPIGLVETLFPSAHITSGMRPPTHPLSRANPGSFHNTANGGWGIDMAAIPGQSVESVRQALASRGLNVAEAIDEYVHPSPHSTGPHWHFGGPRTPATGPGTAHAQSGNQPAVANLPASPPMIEEPGGFVMNNDSMAALIGALASAGDDPRQTVEALSALFGGDHGVRAALAMQGTNPTKDTAASRQAAVNNASRDQFSDLAKAVIPENIRSETGIHNQDTQNATSRANNTDDNARALQVENISQAGMNSRNSADIKSREGIAAADRQSREDIAAGKGQGKQAKFSPAQLGNMDSEIDAQIGADGKIDADAKTAVRARAVDLLQSGSAGGNPAAAVQQALREKAQKYDVKGTFGGIQGYHYKLREQPQNKVVNGGARTVTRGKDGKLSFREN